MLTGGAPGSGVGAPDAAKEIAKAVADVGRTFLRGLASGISGLTAFFLLKDGPTIGRWIERHMGMQPAEARIVGVPLLGAIAIVTFLASYVPIIGAWTAGIFVLALALATTGRRRPPPQAARWTCRGGGNLVRGGGGEAGSQGARLDLRRGADPHAPAGRGVALPARAKARLGMAVRGLPGQGASAGSAG